MPEGDNIHSLAQALGPVLVGRTLERVWTRTHGEVPRLVGQTVDVVEAVGKHLLVGIGSAFVLRIHLGLRGTLRRWDPDRVSLRWDTSAVLATTDDAFVWRLARTVDLVRAREPQALRALEHVGPDLLAPQCDTDEVVRRARALTRPETPMVDVLLDQRIAAGIGNIYKSEVLFLMRLSPHATIGEIDDATLRRAYELARELLVANVGPGRRDTIGPVDPRTTVHPRARRWVYRRVDRPCRRCGERIRVERLGRDDRSTYSCPRCQRATA